MDKKKSLDLLSDLPLNIIHDILSLVPIRDAVRTSLLSMQWRYIWASLPYLAFDRKCVNPPMETEIDQKWVIHFISQALLLHKGPIHKFQLCLPSMEESQCVDQWLIFLSRNGVKNLVLEYDDGEAWIVAPPSLYSCQNLTHLKLHVNFIPPSPPSFKGFLFFRSLDIFVVEEDSSTIKSIVAHSPLLEELTLGGYAYSTVTICALNLKYLHFRDVFNLTLYTSRLQELKGYFDNTMYFSIGVESLMFHHLRTIQLSLVSLNDRYVTPAVTRLITGSPNLQKLEISGRRTSFEDVEPEPDCFWELFCIPTREVSFRYAEPDCFWDTEPAPDVTYNSLKVIKIEDSRGYIDEMKLIEFLLARSPVLETLVYKPHSILSETKSLNLMIQLLTYCRASANAQIVIHKLMKPF